MKLQYRGLNYESHNNNVIKRKTDLIFQFLGDSYQLRCSQVKSNSQLG